MKLHKLFTLGLLSTFMLASCDNVEEPVYTPAEPVANPDACFKMGDNTTVQLKEDQSSIEVTVYRKSGKGQATFPIQASDVAPVYTTYPTEVVFEDGQTTTTFSVGVDFEKVVPLEKYNITFTLPGVSNTDYYLGTITYTCYYEPWKLVTGPNGETTARWRDNIFWGLFSWPEEYQEWDVTIEQSPSDPGVYRIQNPYRTNEFLKGLEGAVDMSDDLYIYLNMTDPEQVFFCDKNGEAAYFVNSGVNFSPEYGEMLIGSEANYALSNGEQPAPDDYGKFRNGNLTWGTKKMLVAMSATGNIYYANGDGLFRVVWPGFEPAEDPENTWTTIGEAEFTDGWLYPLIGEDPVTVAVNVQQNGANPDLYRLVDPFMYILGQPSEGIFMYLDCTNHNNVMMPLDNNFTGLSMDGSSLYAVNMAEIYMNWMQDPLTEEEVIENGLNSTFDGTTISVPANCIAVIGVSGNGFSVLRIEKPADGKIVLPTAEQTAAYKKSNHFQKFVAPSERRKIAIDNLFKGKIVPIKNIGALKNLK